MKCIYCNTQCKQEIVSQFTVHNREKFSCNKCFGKVFYYIDIENNKLIWTVIYYDNFNMQIALNYTSNTTVIYFNSVPEFQPINKFRQLIFNSILEFTPQNIQDKLKTIVNFS